MISELKVIIEVTSYELRSGGSSIVFNKHTAAETLMMSADRAQHFDEPVLPKIQAGKHVVSDPSAFSWLTYQGYERMLKSSNCQLKSEFFQQIKLDMKLEFPKLVQRL